MSRSYHKIPHFKLTNDRDFKRIFNRRIRRCKLDIGNGNRYKKFNSSYDICDFKCIYYSERDLKEYQELFGKSYQAWVK